MPLVDDQNNGSRGTFFAGAGGPVSLQFHVAVFIGDRFARLRGEGRQQERSGKDIKYRFQLALQLFGLV